MLLKPTDLEIIKRLDMKHPYVWLATWFGSGFMRPAPGTWGSLFSILPALLVYFVFGVMGVLIGIAFIFFLNAPEFSTYLVNDATFTTSVVVDSVTVYFTNTSGSWWSVDEATLNIFDGGNKTSRL